MIVYSIQQKMKTTTTAGAAGRTRTRGSSSRVHRIRRMELTTSVFPHFVFYFFIIAFFTLLHVESLTQHHHQNHRVLHPRFPSQPIPCPFNGLCSCTFSQTSLPEIYCIRVPLLRIPPLPTGHFYRVSIVSSPDIHDIPMGIFKETSVSSLTLTGTKLSELEESSLSGTEETLTTLDLSENQLRTFPTSSLAKLRFLQWLNLKGNLIDEVKSHNLPISSQTVRRGGDFADEDHNQLGLRTLLLSDNRLSVVHDGTFSQLDHLQSLDLAGNMITKIEGRPFPSSLTSLSLSQNLLEVIPVQSLSNLRNIKWLQLRGNLIKNLPQDWFLPKKSIEILDLSHNLVESLPKNLFIVHSSSTRKSPSVKYDGDIISDDKASSSHLHSPSSLTRDESESMASIGELHLDFNLLQELEAEPLRSSLIRRLSLSNNKLSNLPKDIFEGRQESYLQALDLNYNQLSSLPESVKKLTRLTSLFLRGNRLNHLTEDSFISCKDHLQSLDLSSNSFDKIPSQSLQSTSRLLRLNLQDNLITTLTHDDLGKWSSGLLSLTLSKNDLSRIPSETFRNTKNLKELRLSFNRLETKTDVDSLDFLLPLRKSLVSLELTSASTATSSRTFISGRQRTAWDLHFLERLETLELDSNDFSSLSAHLISNLTSLLHLDLEGNRIKRIPQDFFSNLGNGSRVRNILLSDNRLEVIEGETFTSLNYLMNVIISNNEIDTIRTKAFDKLPALLAIVLSNNKIGQIEAGSFSQLPQLRELNLQNNRLKEFSLDILHLSEEDHEVKTNERGKGKLTSRLDEEDEEDEVEDEGSIIYDSASSTSSTSSVGLSINISHNEITELKEFSFGEKSSGSSLASSLLVEPVKNIRSLDASHNHISRLGSLDFLCSRGLVSLLLSNNRLTSFPLESLANCSRLQALTLKNNFISSVDCRSRTSYATSTVIPSFSTASSKSREDLLLNGTSNEEVKRKERSISSTSCDGGEDRQEILPSLQTLILSNNQISDLKVLGKLLLRKLSNLKILDLNFNQIEVIDSSIFEVDTDGGRMKNKVFKSIEKLSLRGNRILNVAFECPPLLSVLDISSNKLSSPLPVCASISTFNLSHNQIYELNDTSLFGYNNLKELDLSGNIIKKMSLKSLHPLNNLQELVMSKCALTQFPDLQLPKLVKLDLSKNLLSNTSSHFLSKARNVKQLDLSSNLLPDMPKGLWRFVPGLIHLDVSFNPIEVLETSSLNNLLKLRHLDMAGLSLKYMDSRLLHSLRHLISIKTSTYPGVRSFRIHDLLVKSTSLRSVSITIQESILSHQIQGAFSPKLKELIITGNNLVKILPDAFLGLSRTSGLILRITGTNVSRLPDGLLRSFSGDGLGNRLSLIDLRNNKLRSLTPHILQSSSDPPKDGTKRSSLNYFSNGLLLDNNPWICSCELRWLSDWLRRWVKETRRSHMYNSMDSVSMDITSSISHGSCIERSKMRLDDENDEGISGGRDSKKVPLIDFHGDYFDCHDVSESSSLSSDVQIRSSTELLSFVTFLTTLHITLDLCHLH